MSWSNGNLELIYTSFLPRLVFFFFCVLCCRKTLSSGCNLSRFRQNFFTFYFYSWSYKPCFSIDYLGSHYSFGEPLLSRFKSYLSDRAQCVAVRRGNTFMCTSKRASIASFFINGNLQTIIFSGTKSLSISNFRWWYKNIS